MRWAQLQNIILFHESLYGLPWMFLGLLLPFLLKIEGCRPFSAIDCVYVVIAFFLARMAGMSLNRYIDRKIDALNPRTCLRALPTGAISSFSVLTLGIVSLGGFIVVCSLIDSRCFYLSGVVAILLIFYSYTKRYTSLCHAVLGAIHCISPICAWMATGAYFSWIPCLLGISVGLSIMANDIVYALQDLQFDQQMGLFSIPSRYGKEKALSLARNLHALAVCVLLILGYEAHFTSIYFMGVFAIAYFYFQYHLSIVSAFSSHDISSLQKRFSFANKCIGFMITAAILGDWAWRVS